ncbi:MAG: tRNA uridine-5-carboxymethylaminomethyl(34) synthesis GTPase MnmE [Hydrogenobacter thermophilus]|uniref:tRNA uridine-5-carboxymethylaminomethyl(34) synthesis GTPase MnmE n=1 Tax=Hydrogenobacter thermophilus TaxID=940 RepID=UPI001C76C5BA|nr:tRNA uridine-5-carboxymethylaminomethyl(34) synthesis GTPase MnmE [Hydrogenobacter thermophilus]QWK19346.1 MAG: tRNA uridine-5-carboxymethylaminomethyl(34) synthesis GTPase MnmE [Hydrogenobacter thermophilus]
MVKQREPIIAIATPYGESAIGMIRISGLGVLEKVKKYVRTKGEIKPRYAHFFTLLDEDGQVLDEGVLIYYKSPSSYTGEDMIEMCLHGNPLILKRSLELFLKEGIRLAEPGEFTKRAFLNGKLDMVQAEAVADLINAKTDLARKVAIRQLQGELSKYVNSLREKLIQLLAYVEADIEFSEQDIPTISREEILQALKDVQNSIETLLSTVKAGELLRKGINLAIVGKPNVGKSSLFNALLGRERAIVTEVPGTTRDFLSEELHMEGIPVNLVDTAGIRETQDKVESIGVKRSIESIKAADLVLFVVDASKPLEKDDWDVYNLVKQRDHIKVLNKVDLGLDPSIAKIFPDGVKVSAKMGDGIEDLKKSMLEKLGVFGYEGMKVYVSVRQAELLKKSLEIIRSLIQSLEKQDISSEILALELRETLSYLDEMVGAITTEDVLSAIFSRFCIGK